jgi:hypothetical protein
MINEKKDACYHKVKSRYSVWPSAYASGALVKCRKKGAKNWGNSRKDEALHTAYFNFAAVLLEVTARGVGLAAGSAVEKLKQSGASKEAIEKKQAQELRVSQRVQDRASERAEKYRPGSGKKASEVAGERFLQGKRVARGIVKGGAGDTRGANRPAEGSSEARQARRRRADAAQKKLADLRGEEEIARAAARGTTRRQKTFSVDPNTGEVNTSVEGEGEGISGEIKSFGKRYYRSRKERLADDPGVLYRASKSGLKSGVAKAKAKREKLDFSHTEYQRIGDILAEAKGVMPKKFSVKSGDKSAAGGLTAKGVKRYRAANPGSKLKTAVTTKPSKLKKGSKSANRRKSFCARMGGMKKRLTSSKTANDPNSRINKALRKWNC